MAQAALADSAYPATPWLQGRSFESWREQFDTNGFLIFERVLTPETVAAIRAALAPHLARDLKGRNDFEGLSTNRVYALLAKSPVFSELVTHPLALAFVEQIVTHVAVLERERPRLGDKARPFAASPLLRLGGRSFFRCQPSGA